MKRILFLLLIVASLLLSPALSLFMGILYAICFGSVLEANTHKLSATLLKISIIGIGFGMNLMESLRSSYEGIIFTIFSVVVVMVSGVFLSRRIGVERSEGYLIASGTAICGGSAIAAIAPVIRAKSSDISISLAVVFTLNAIAMIIFPPIGRALQLSQSQFGMWSAIAIHDTSAVVGAAKAYGQEALQIATTVKLSRALWIIPLSLITPFVFKNKESQTHGGVSIPWFIPIFVLAMAINTYMPLGQTVSNIINIASHKLLNIALLLIGTTLSWNSIKLVGVKPILLGVLLWILISSISLIIITLW